MDNEVVITEVGESSDLEDVEADLDPRLPELKKKIGPVEGTTPILVDENDHSKVLQVGSLLEATLRGRLIGFLKENLDIFDWSHADMVGIDPDVMCHRLNIDPQKKGETETKGNKWRKGRSFKRGSRSSFESWFSEGVFLPKLVGKSCACKEIQREVESLCGLHGLKQGMHQR